MGSRRGFAHRTRASAWVRESASSAPRSNRRRLRPDPRTLGPEVGTHTRPSIQRHYHRTRRSTARCMSRSRMQRGGAAGRSAAVSSAGRRRRDFTDWSADRGPGGSARGALFDELLGAAPEGELLDEGTVELVVAGVGDRLGDPALDGAGDRVDGDHPAVLTTPPGMAVVEVVVDQGLEGGEALEAAEAEGDRALV